MKKYTVNYWNGSTGDTGTIENVLSDGVVPDMPHRYFVEEDGTRHEVPVSDTVFKFSKERTELIKQLAEEKAKAEAAK